MRISCVYTITNLIDGKIYVGYSNNLKHRIETHLSNFKLNNHKNNYLLNAVNKYGWENFTLEVLEECEERFLTALEHYWATILNTHNPDFGYNLKPTHPDGKSGINTKRLCKKSVIQYSADGKKIKEFPSLREAKSVTDSHHISACCNGKRVSAGGYFWKYKEEGIEAIKNPPKIKRELRGEEVLEIRRLYKEGKKSIDIANIFDIKQRTVQQIVNNSTHHNLLDSEEQINRKRTSKGIQYF